ncbi:MAG: nuclear transport factor 2 family protein [Gemmatimonadetes bacterium]|nr:nuclear transport factor 2 family protein [Gemmatimonadota bacterium]
MRLPLITCLFLAPLLLQAQAPADRDGVRRAAMDYLEGFYEGDSTKHLRSIRPEVYKYGFYKPAADKPYQGNQMTWAGFMDFTRNVRTRKNFAPATAPKEVAILEVQDQTAAAKVTAWWGTDYLLLGKFDDRWMVTHVLWQSPPPRP